MRKYTFYRFIFILVQIPFLLGGFLSSCNSSPQKQDVNGAFIDRSTTPDTDIENIEQSGQLIIATLSGPDTYFDYQGRGMGLQYALAEDFASQQGVSIRVELATDTLHLVKMLNAGDADIIALQLPEHFCKKNGILQAGVCDQKRHTTWAVRADAEALAQRLDEWFNENVLVTTERKEQNRLKERAVVRRRVQAPIISREKGIISIYDAQFKQAAQHIGWDWKLIAAQCYQESGFDPNAVSWAGASGLMQLMPATAAQVGLHTQQIFSPTENIAAAARHIRQLQNAFSSVTNPEERTKLVLAAYNGGLGHIRDAQALARKYGKDPQRWADVGLFVRRLGEQKYYRDPVVRYGYMIGNETYGYVEQIMQRWRQYGGNPSVLHREPGTPSDARNSESGHAPAVRKENKFSKQQRILQPEEFLKH